MKTIHVLAIPYPAQGHVMPLMEAARCFTNYGLKVTFVNSELTNKRLLSSGSSIDVPSDLLQMVSIPDGMEPFEDRNEHGRLAKTMFQFMPSKLEELINDINKNEDDRITCIIVDYCMGWLNSNIAKENALNLQEKVMECLKAGNSSHKSLNKFIDWVKEENDHKLVNEPTNDNPHPF